MCKKLLGRADVDHIKSLFSRAARSSTLRIFKFCAPPAIVPRLALNWASYPTPTLSARRGQSTWPDNTISLR